MFTEHCLISALSYSFVLCGGVGWVVGGFQEITKSQPNYNFDYFAVGVVVVVGLWQFSIKSSKVRGLDQGALSRLFSLC